MAAVLAAVATLGMSAAHGASFDDWATVDTGLYAHTCGVRENGKLYCWGVNGTGQIGDGGTGTAYTPKRVGLLVDWSAVSAGRDHTCGVRRNGKLYCWGADNAGQVGDGGSNATKVVSPRRIGSFVDWAQVSAGRDHTCGVRTNGKLYCWGFDGSGQVGDGDGIKAKAPRRIGTFADWGVISAGWDHTCGVRTNGKLYCWGFDGSGQVGDGDGTDAEAPRRIGAFKDWSSVSAGGDFSCGIRSGGELFCWGSDSFGQVGDGEDSDPTDAPKRIGILDDWTNVATGISHACGVRTNGELYCWGSDESGKVGDGDSAEPATAPRRIGVTEVWANVSAGGGHTCGLTSGAKLFCWGNDVAGQLGDGGSAEPATTPRLI